MTQEHPPIPVGDDVTIYDNTMIKAFLSCPRFFYWRHIRHLDTLSKGIPLHFGIAIHSGLDAYYQGHLDQIGREQSILAMIQAFVDDFKIPGDEKRNLDNGVRILNNYVKNHPVENEFFKIEEVEKVFEIVLDPERKIHFFGRIDLIINWPGYGIIVVDHKTASWISDNYMKAHATDRQFAGYVVAMREHYEKVYGALINVLEVPKTLSRDPKTHRELVSKNKFDQATWVVETLNLVEQMGHCKATKVWPMNAPFYCTAWNRMCEYFDLCSSHQHPEDVIVDMDKFQIKEWTPFVSEVEK
jgi:hypothetical protein